MSSRTLSEEIQVHLAFGEVSEALLLLQSAAISYPNSRFFAEKLAMVAYQAGEFQNCREALNRCRRLGGDSEVLRLIEPGLLLKEGSEADAVAAALALVSANPRNEATLRAALPVLEFAGHEAVAIVWRSLGEIGRIAPAETIHAVRTLHAANDLASANRLLDRLLAREPGHREAIIEKLALWMSNSKSWDAGDIETIVSIVGRDLECALTFLHHLHQSQRWNELLLLVQRVREKGEVWEAFQDIAVLLVDDAERAEADGRYGVATVVWFILSLIGSPDARAEWSERARSAATAALANLMVTENAEAAALTVEAVVIVAEAGGPIPSALADIASHLSNGRLVARAALACWRKTGQDGLLKDAIDAILRSDSMGTALSLLVSLPNLPLGHPAVAARTQAFAERADKALETVEPTVQHDLIKAASILLSPEASAAWPKSGARSYAKKLRQAIKIADEEGDADAAIELAEAVALLMPENAYPYKVLARLYTARGAIPMAKKYFRKLMTLEPEKPEYAIRYARRCHRSDDRREIIDILVGAVERHPDHPGIQQMLDRWLLEPIG